MKTVLLCAICAVPLFAAQPDFSGTWEFSPSKSRNIGMMANMKLTAVIKQTASELVITDKVAGRGAPLETRLDLTGAPVVNQTPMEGKAETVTTWSGSRLVTTWTSEGSVAGTKSVRTESRSLSPDGRLLTVESVRGKNPPIVMVYERR